MLTHIPEDGLPNGILLYSIHPPTLEEMREAVARFHEFPVVRNMPFVVLEKPENLPDSDKIALHHLGCPGFENL